MAPWRWVRIMIAPPLFSLFFLYLFWARPAAILSQEYLLTDWFLGQNIFIIIAAAIFVIFLAISIAGFFFFPKLLDGLTFFVCTVVLAMTLIRYILPYSYGSFADNLSCTPTLSLLGFTPWYYMLDALVLIGTTVFVIFLIKNNNLYKFSALLLLFYAVEFAMTLGSFRMQSQGSESEVYFDLNLSQNHPNVLIIIYDSLSPVIGREFFTRYVSKEYRESLKDFTFYDNFINPASGHTIAGLPMMFGGPDYSEQRQIAVFEKKIISRVNPIHISNKSFYFSDEALVNLEDNLIESTFVQYREFPAYRETLDESGQKKAIYAGTVGGEGGAAKINALTPIVYTPLYSHSPYFARRFLAKDFSWKYFVQEGWLSVPGILRILRTDTPGPVLQILHNHGAHVDHSNPISGTGVDTAQSPEAAYQIYMDQMTYNTGILPHMLERLHSLGVYDNTKVIILSDHGFTSLLNKSNALAAIEALSPKAAQFYKEAPEEIYSVPAFLMVKGTKAYQNEMKTDSRFLAMTDVPSIISSTLKPNNDTSDYTIQRPPTRSFIFPLIPNTWDHKTSFKEFFNKLTNNYLKNGNITLAEFTGLYEYSLNEKPFTSLGALPGVEHVKGDE